MAASMTVQILSKRACCALLLAASSSLAAAPLLEPGVAYRFGDWLLLRPAAAVPPSTARAGLVVIDSGEQDENLYLFNRKAASDTAVQLHFDGRRREQDFAALRRGDASSRRLKGCDDGRNSDFAIKSLRRLIGKNIPALTQLPELSDDSLVSIHTAAGERSLRRVGEELIADLGGYRIKLALDTDTLRLGDPVSGDFCYFEAPAASED